MVHYYGVIVCTMDRTTDLIEGDHDRKPPVEHAGWFTSCHWFTDHIEALTYQLAAETVFLRMSEKDGKVNGILTGVI